MIHPDTDVVHISDEIGKGAKATKRIPRGTIVWALDRFDIALSASDLMGLPEPHRALAEKYGYLDHRGRRILCWDGGRFVNHSCRPTTRGLGGDLQIAIRDIEVGEEITCDYAECNCDPPLDCMCGNPGCRGVIRAHDLLDHADAWDKEVAIALADAARVPQPLLPFVVNEADTLALIRGQRPMPSLRSIYFDPAHFGRTPTREPSTGAKNARI